MALGVNDTGQVVGLSYTVGGQPHAFRTAPNRPINPATDDLGTLGGSSSYAYAINSSGQVVGYSSTVGDEILRAFRTPSNSAINPADDDLGTLGGWESFATAVNKSGQVVGWSDTASDQVHAFRTAPNRPIDPATDDLGTLGGSLSVAAGINGSGQVVGHSFTADDQQQHPFRTAPNGAINPATDDLGTLGGLYAGANAINNSGQVVGWSNTASGAIRAFLYSDGLMYDLNNLIPANSGWTLHSANAINDLGQIAVYGFVNGASHALRLDPPPARFASYLLEAITSFHLPPGASSPLSSILHSCLDALERGDHTAARNQLGAFERLVSAQRSKHLADAQADLLLAVSARAIELLA